MQIPEEKCGTNVDADGVLTWNVTDLGPTYHKLHFASVIQQKWSINGVTTIGNQHFTKRS